MTAVRNIQNPIDPDPLDLLRERALIVARRVTEGRLSFIDGVDLAYSAAIWSGLAERYGDDVVQRILADTFMGTPKDRTP